MDLKKFWFSKENIIHNSVHILISLALTGLTYILFKSIWQSVWTIWWVSFFIEADQIRMRIKNKTLSTTDWFDVVRDILTYIVPGTAYIIILKYFFGI